jgi:hypothetical protein
MKFMYMTYSAKPLSGIALLLLLSLFYGTVHAQDTTSATAPATPSAPDTTGRGHTLYTFIFNQVPQNSDIPLVGVVNIAEGNQEGFQLGVTNLNQRNFKGAQIGFSNVIGGSATAAQLGFVNAARYSFEGGQIGYVNIVAESMKGAQIGFVSAARKSVNGAQVSFVNVGSAGVEGAQVGGVNVCAGNINGFQVGQVNVATKHAEGAQVGFINVSQTLDGAQVGFINTAAGNVNGSQVGFINVVPNTLKGAQIGFINIADSISDGVPLGFLSIVKKGGFCAAEISANELYPVNVSFKIGVKPLYTTFGASYNPDFKRSFALGAGIGSIIDLSKYFYLNPEVISMTSVEREENHQFFLTLSTLLGCSFSKHVSIAAGPSFTWTYMERDNSERVFYKPAASLYEHTIDNRNRLHAGGRVALRFHF